MSFENRECHGTNEDGVNNDTPGCDQLVLAGLVGPVTPEHGTEKVEELEEEGNVELVNFQTPEGLDELEDEGVGRVDQPIKEEVQHLWDKEVRVIIDVFLLFN